MASPETPRLVVGLKRERVGRDETIERIMLGIVVCDRSRVSLRGLGMGMVVAVQYVD